MERSAIGGGDKNIQGFPLSEEFCLLGYNAVQST
jgi:hypothetical protein